MKAAVIGGGVIGGGWVARFLLNGWDVAVYDPDPDAERKIGAMLAHARRSLPSLYDYALPPEGTLTFSPDVAGAVQDTQWIQESVPERLPDKQSVYREIQSSAAATAVLASSTSGFPPSALCENAIRPEQILVVHPFNPVYLLPLVEIVPSPLTADTIRKQAESRMKQVGMHPLLVRREIAGHINDRLQEALWREALWLVHDGIATTQEIDDSVRYGCGLRWAQMGTFQTFWLAGGEGGIRHFLAQFGPALKWPWTKLMEVPELSDHLLDTLADQCDQQSGGWTPRDMERIRDDNLVGMMRALKRTDWASGATLNRHDRNLVPEVAMTPAPVEVFCRQIPQSWLDYNGHMNETHYLEAFSQANDRIMELIGADQDYIDQGFSYFTVETHIRHLGEVQAGETIRVTSQILEGQGKKLRVFHRMETVHGDLVATGEHLMIHVHLGTRKSCDPEAPVRTRLALCVEAHQHLPFPEGAGRSVG